LKILEDGSFLFEYIHNCKRYLKFLLGKRETFNSDSSKKNKVYISIQKFVGTVAFFYHYSFHGPEIKFVDNLTSNGLLQQKKLEHILF
jgi:hypothetical protein